MKRICKNCEKEIGEREHYYEVIERENKEVLSRKFVHKKCHERYEEGMKNQLNLSKLAVNLAGKANKLLNKYGEEEVVNL